MTKGSIQEGDITIININAPNTGAPQYIRQTLTDIKGEIDSNTITVGNFNSPLTPMDRSSKQKINKGTQVLKDTLDEMDLTDIFRTFHPNAEEYTFFSSAHRIFSTIDHILGHKSNLSKFKKIEIVSSTWRLNNTFPNKQQVTEEIKREIKKILEKDDNSKPMGCSKSSSKREVYTNSILPQETRKTSNRQPNFTPKATGKRRRRKK